MTTFGLGTFGVGTFGIGDGGDGLSFGELTVQRRLTKIFIACDPTDLALTPRTRVRTPTGGWSYVDGPARPTQRFKLIRMSANQKPTTTVDGQVRIIDFTLLGLWDAQVGLYDYWRDDASHVYEVVEIVPEIGYQTKALIERRRG